MHEKSWHIGHTDIPGIGRIDDGRKPWAEGVIYGMLAPKLKLNPSQRLCGVNGRYGLPMLLQRAEDRWQHRPRIGPIGDFKCMYIKGRSPALDVYIEES